MSEHCVVCNRDIKIPPFSPLDLDPDAEIALESMVTYVALPAGQTEARFHTHCLAKTIQHQAQSANPVNPVNRVPIPSHIVKKMHEFMDFFDIPHKSDE